MNGEIKFRVWSKSFKQWMNHCAVIDCSGNIGSHFVEVKENKEFLEHFAPLPKEDCIVQQFTGLLDKNGKEIYEGDILKIAAHANSPEFGKNGKVYWNNSHGAYWISFNDGTSAIPQLNTSTNGIMDEKSRDEIIGNIFENPELVAKASN